MEHEDVENEFSRSILFCKIKNGTLNDNLQTADFCALYNLINYGTSSSSYSLIQTLASIALLLWNFIQVFLTFNFGCVFVGYGRMWNVYLFIYSFFWFFTFDHAYVGYHFMLSFFSLRSFVIHLIYVQMLNFILNLYIFMVACLIWTCTLYFIVFKILAHSMVLKKIHIILLFLHILTKYNINMTFLNWHDTSCITLSLTQFTNTKTCNPLKPFRIASKIVKLVHTTLIIWQITY
jgi:hypothetical protein